MIEVLLALKAIQAEADAGHDRLLLLDDHAGVVLYGAEIEVVLDAESEAEHERQQQEEPGAEAFDEGRKSHSDKCYAGLPAIYV